MGDDGIDTGPSLNGEGQSQGNPAWNEFLNVVPQELHPQVTPILQKWDQGVNERFQKVQSDYEPWKPIIGSGVSPEDVQTAVNILNTINTNPEFVYNSLGEYYKFGQATEPGTTGQGQGEPVQDDPYDARFAEIERQNQILAQTLYNQKQREIQDEEDHKLDSELSALRNKYKQQGDFDEDYVLGKMTNGMDADAAVQAFFKMRDGLLQQQGLKPLILGGGGPIPGQNTDVRKLDEKGTKALVVEMLQHAARQNQ